LTILKLCFDNPGGSNVGISFERDLGSIQLRRAQMPIYIYTKFDKNWFKHRKAVRGIYTQTHIHREEGDIIILLLLF
jgi:hypothetical protein